MSYDTSDRRFRRDLNRAAEVGAIHMGRPSERVVGGRALGRRHRPRLSPWTHPAWLLVLAVAVVAIAAWSRA